MMKVPFVLPDDGLRHEYCLNCGEEAVRWEARALRRSCVCHACGTRAERSLVLDPAVRWWVASDGEYWHETAGVFVRAQGSRFLLFDRTSFPFALTVPAGHVAPSEPPLQAAVRELFEETGIIARELIHLASERLVGDVCRRGSDAHVWHAYMLDLPEIPAVDLNEEGVTALWPTLDELRDCAERQGTFAVRALVSKYAHLLGD